MNNEYECRFTFSDDTRLHKNIVTKYIQCQCGTTVVIKIGHYGTNEGSSFCSNCKGQHRVTFHGKEGRNKDRVYPMRP